MISSQFEWLNRIQQLAYPRQAGTHNEEKAILEIIKDIQKQNLNFHIHTVPITTFKTGKSYLTTILPINKNISCVPIGFTGSLKKNETYELVYTEMGNKNQYLGELNEKIALVFGPIRLKEYKALVEKKVKGAVIIGEPGRPINHYCVPISYVEQCGELPSVSIGFKDGLWLAKQIKLKINMIVDQVQIKGVTKNIIVSLPGILKTRENVVIGAHFDTVQNVPGVQDNLAACILMIDLAREFSKEVGNLDLHFVWFGGEELGSMDGSFHFIKEESSIIANTQCMVTLDGTGGIVGTNRIRVMGNETITRFVKRITSLEKTLWHIESGCYWTDGIPFCEMGIPVINIFRDGGTYEFVHSTKDSIDLIKVQHLNEYFNLNKRIISALRNQEIPIDRKISKKIRKEMTYFYKYNLGIERRLNLS